MQAYMKSAMPYLGIPLPTLRALVREATGRHPPHDFDEWCRAIALLWREARYREERYAALAVAGDRRHRDWATQPGALSLYEELVVTGAWWDLVDDVATHRLAAMLVARPDVVRPVMLAWSRDANLWKRRSAIICQVTLRAAADAALLYECIEPNLDDRSFWIRKAIGWALRERSKIAPEEVREYVAMRGDRLSGLSKREALRWQPGAARERLG
jgi:3-methyladenine DNA glycosylase AlkD